MRQASRLDIEISPPKLFVDIEENICITVRDQATGKPIAGASVLVGGGNIDFSGITDDVGQFSRKASHYRSGTTHVFAIADGYEPEIRGWDNEPAASFRSLFNSMNNLVIGETYKISPELYTYWINLTTEEFFISQGESKQIKFEISQDLEELHFLVRWYGVQNELAAQWQAPDESGLNDAERVCKDKLIEWRGRGVGPLIIQPGGGGGIVNPKRGEWSIVTTGKICETQCRAVIEVYGKLLASEIIQDGSIGLHGAGLAAHYDLVGFVDGSVNFSPTESGPLLVSIRSRNCSATFALQVDDRT